MWYWDGMSMGGGWMIFGIIAVIIFWAVVIGLVVWGIRKLAGRNNDSVISGGRTPLDIAKERYAKGEITLAQFEEIKKNL